MRLQFGDYILTTGWGGRGIFDADKTVAINTTIKGTGREVGPDEASRLHPDLLYSVPIIEEDAVVIGTGSGYEEFLSDDKVCVEMINCMNSHEPTTKAPSEQI